MEGKSFPVEYAREENPKRNSLLKHNLAYLFYNCVVFKKNAKAQTNQSKRPKGKFKENPKGCIYENECETKKGPKPKNLEHDTFIQFKDV